MRSINELNDQEVARVIQAIRCRAAGKGEKIIKGKDGSGTMGFMIADASTNTVTAGEDYSIDLETLAAMYNVVY